MTDKPTTKIESDPFFRTAFSYEYIGVGDIRITTSGYINSVKVDDKYIYAFFRAPLAEKYMVHAMGDGLVCICHQDNHGFYIVNADPDKKIRFSNNVSAMIQKVPEGLSK